MLLDSKKSTSSIGALLALGICSLTVVASQAPAKATTCSFTIYTPTTIASGGRTLAQAHTSLNCNGILSGSVNAQLWRDVTLLPDVKVADNTDTSQDSNYDFNAVAKGCDASGQTKGYYTKGSGTGGYSGTSSKVDLTCY